MPDRLEPSAKCVRTGAERREGRETFSRTGGGSVRFQPARMDGNPLIFGRHSMAPYTPKPARSPGQDRGALLTRRDVIQIPHDAEKPNTHTPQKNDHESKSIFHPITPFFIVRLL